MTEYETRGTPLPDPKMLMDIVTTRMPFGRYSGRCIADLPEPYLVWFNQEGFPKGKLGELMETVYVMKLNGLDHMFVELKRIAQSQPHIE